ncbi:ATP-binding protein [Streptomyces sp. NPDC017941]|uniref:ATP-binding protein n=1 Tax=Streptomyces sp. NPDC017941 TaxID=3365018 RepID=UPI0037B4820E
MTEPEHLKALIISTASALWEASRIHKRTILTGHNDCGKTATLDAITFLLGERATDDSDISVFAVGELGRLAATPRQRAAGPRPQYDAAAGGRLGVETGQDQMDRRAVVGVTSQK